MRHLLVVLITRYSIFFHGSVNYHYRNEKVFEILFLTLTYPQPLFSTFRLLLLNNVDCKILKKNKDQLLLDGYRYRHANKSQVIWRCCKNNYAGLLRFNGIEYVKVTDHAHAPNSGEIISIINTVATTSRDPYRRIIHELLLYINKNDGTAVPNYLSTQRTIERKRKQQDKPLPTPTSFNDISMPDEIRVANDSERSL